MTSWRSMISPSTMASDERRRDAVVDEPVPAVGLGLELDHLDRVAPDVEPDEGLLLAEEHALRSLKPGALRHRGTRGGMPPVVAIPSLPPEGIEARGTRVLVVTRVSARRLVQLEGGFAPRAAACGAGGRRSCVPHAGPVPRATGRGTGPRTSARPRVASTPVSTAAGARNVPNGSAVRPVAPPGRDRGSPRRPCRPRAALKIVRKTPGQPRNAPIMQRQLDVAAAQAVDAGRAPVGPGDQPERSPAGERADRGPRSRPAR